VSRAVVLWGGIDAGERGMAKSLKSHTPPRRHREQARPVLRNHPGQRSTMHFGLCTGLLQEEPQRADCDEISVNVIKLALQLQYCDILPVDQIF
jgi:hypothetical protein